MSKVVLILLAGLASVAPQAARAGWCEDLWYTRNAIMDRAGMCFGSVLGQAVFDNTGCTGSSVKLDPQFAELVNYLSSIEAREGCRVDTSRRVLELVDLAVRRQLVELPVPSDTNPGFNCIGWRGAVQPLRAARAPGAAAVGRVEPGDFVGMWNAPGGGWTYVRTYSRAGGPFKSAGWMQSDWDANQFCADQAG